MKKRGIPPERGEFINHLEVEWRQKPTRTRFAQTMGLQSAPGVNILGGVAGGAARKLRQINEAGELFRQEIYRS